MYFMRSAVCFAASYLTAGTLVAAGTFFASSGFSATSALAKQCAGVRTKRVRAKVVGGWQANLDQWPGQVVLRAQSVDDKRSVYFCGGTLISPRWVLTAAHCVEKMKIFRCNGGRVCQTKRSFSKVKPGEWRKLTGRKIIQAVAGTAELRADLPAGHIRNVVLKISHKDYSHVTNRNDIALLRLDQPMNIKPARLSMRTNTDPDVRLQSSVYMVAGFGYQERDEKYQLYPQEPPKSFAAGSDVLKEVHLPAVPISTCSKHYRQVDEKSETQLCAGHEQGRHDTCQGDSGGPLVAFNKKGCPYQVGITSFGKRACATTKSYSVYTRISHYADWIKEWISGGVRTKSLVTDDEGDARTAQQLAEDKAEAQVMFQQAATVEEVLTREEVEAQKAFAASALGEVRDMFDKASGGKRVKLTIIDKASGQRMAPGEALRIGRSFQFELESDVGGVLILLEVGPQGVIKHLHPTEQTKRIGFAEHLAGGRAVLFPANSAFRASKPYGDHKLVVLVVPDVFKTDALAQMRFELDLTKGTKDLRIPANYIANLIDKAGEVIATRKIKTWAYGELDYKIVE